MSRERRETTMKTSTRNDRPVTNIDMVSLITETGANTIRLTASPVPVKDRCVSYLLTHLCREPLDAEVSYMAWLASMPA